MKTPLLFLALCVMSVAHAGTSSSPVPVAETPAKSSAASADEQQVCETKKKLGSNRVERICMTVAQRRAAKERAQADLQRLGRCSGNDSVCAGSL